MPTKRLSRRPGNFSRTPTVGEVDQTDPDVRAGLPGQEWAISNAPQGPGQVAPEIRFKPTRDVALEHGVTM